MDSQPVFPPAKGVRQPNVDTLPQQAQYNKHRVEELVLNNLETGKRKADDSSKVQVSFQELYKGLSVSARKIVDALNEKLSGVLPEGIQSLSPEQVTPEATAERIVRGSTAFFGVFQKQNPNLEGEELLSAFMETIRGGISKGYGDAVEILEGLGAFEYDGVKSGIEETRRLIDEKLEVFEYEMRKRLGLETESVKEQVAAPTTQEFIQNGTAEILQIAA